LATFSNSQDFTILNGDPLGLWEGRIHRNDISVNENEIRHGFIFSFSESTCKLKNVLDRLNPMNGNFLT
jgi:hypothetical protein